MTCGIDEAGRGPMIGPMVISGASFDEQAREKLKLLGVKDSKLLSAKRREQLALEIKKIATGIHTIIIQPQEIDAAVESKATNLNWLEA
ncbi:ribonuclease HII, partial [Candidatus Woesearchaeota archaeon]|nr:ribonuclease HII [Candidatus Woesearchaeota archaeon]